MRADIAAGLEASARVWANLFGETAPPITSNDDEQERRHVYAMVLSDEWRARPDLLGGRVDEPVRFAFARAFCDVLREQTAARPPDERAGGGA